MEKPANDSRHFPTAILRRRTTWPRLVPIINDIIYWEDGDPEEIGEGFFSTVYKFNHRPSGQTVVIKAAKDVTQRSDDEQEVMITEIKLLKKLSHENIIKYFGLCAKEGEFHPVLEYINGGSLDKLLLNHEVSLSWSEKIGFCRDVANGMRYLHSNNIFHRDLKSGNCLVREDETGKRTIVVADFGLARQVTGDAKTPRKLSVVGTAYWMAPEVINGGLYSEKVDVFSYGILACEILARVDTDPDELPRTPNYGLDLMKFSSLCPDCPEELLELVKNCTKVNEPFNRPTFDEIADLLEELESEHDVLDYDIIEDLITDNSFGLTMKSLDPSDSVFYSSLSQRNSNFSEDSGLGEECSPKCDGCHDNNELQSRDHSTPKNSDSVKHSYTKKRVSFRFVTSLLSGRRRFKKANFNQDVAPSCGMSLKKCASLPDLKEKSDSADNKLRDSANTRSKKRPKSLYVPSTCQE